VAVRDNPSVPGIPIRRASLESVTGGLRLPAGYPIIGPALGHTLADEAIPDGGLAGRVDGLRSRSARHPARQLADSRASTVDNGFVRYSGFRYGADTEIVATVPAGPVFQVACTRTAAVVPPSSS
jgi:hypothetical protein